MAVQTATALVVLLSLYLGSTRGLLYPRESESREVKNLDGLWYFRADFSSSKDAGFTEEWYSKPLAMTGEVTLMPVPSSWNDITQNVSVKEYIGWVWYERQAWVPATWTGMNIMLRFESAHYNTIAWVNGVEVVTHSGGHLPFEANITDVVKIGAPNRITVAINNTLTPHTLPPGTLTQGGPPDLPEGFVTLNYQFDFYNYAGLHRPVKLYTTPLSVLVENVTVVSSLLSNGSAVVNYEVDVFTTTFGKNVELQLLLNEKFNGTVVQASLSLKECQEPKGCTLTGKGALVVDFPRLWWPWTMRPDDPAFLYQLEVIATTSGVSDYYRLPVGIRTVELTDKLNINGKPIYFHGVDKHEDADIRGKGLDYPLMVKDMNLFKWLGVNAFRTSHYPYAEEFLDLADQYGILVIDECPAVGLQRQNFVNETLEHHLEVMSELVQRDKNRPAVIMWSLANEPQSNAAEAGPYFKTLAEWTRSLDPTRPVAFVTDQKGGDDVAVQYMDTFGVNYYASWYVYAGRPDTIPYTLSAHLEQWHSATNKSFFMSEYGASAISGYHKDPPTMFTEDYQAEVLASSWDVFDKYRDQFLIGELVWNFQDFESYEKSDRPDGNRKGMVTRQRQPKAAARLLRQRYLSLAMGIETKVCTYNDPFGFNQERVYGN